MTKNGGRERDPVEVVPGLSVDVSELVDKMGMDVGEAFLHAGLAIIEKAVREARETPWWSGTPKRIRSQLAAECERGLLVVELGERIQAEQSDYLWELTHGPKLDDDLLHRVRESRRERRAG